MKSKATKFMSLTTEALFNILTKRELLFSCKWRFSHNFKIMAKLSTHDLAIIDEAYSTTYRSTLQRLLKECESECAKRIIEELIKEAQE